MNRAPSISRTRQNVSLHSLQESPPLQCARLTDIDFSLLSPITVAIASVIISNSRGNVILNIAPNPFPSTRIIPRRDSADDRPIEYIQVSLLYPIPHLSPASIVLMEKKLMLAIIVGPRVIIYWIPFVSSKIE